MSPGRRPLPPSTSLPAARSLEDQPESCILSVLSDLSALYCPLPTSLSFEASSLRKETFSAADSGYTSDNDHDSETDEAFINLRDDAYERVFAERWLMAFLGRVEGFSCFGSEDSRQRAIDIASCVLASLASRGKGIAEDTEITRDYHFTLNTGTCTIPEQGEGAHNQTIMVQLTDGLAGKDNNDHTDVGLQSWGAAFIFTQLMCASPDSLNLAKHALGSTPSIIELGAGTGLVGIALGKILPCLGVPTPSIIATDFHPTVLANLRGNIAKNFSSPNGDRDYAPSLIQAAFLDWETPDLSPPLDKQADMLVATDVIYDPEHAVWLRDCAARLLKPDGVFWLMLTVRTAGKFEGISGTVRTSFNGRDGLQDSQGRVLVILDEECFARPGRIGRGDETEYRLFKIGWSS
ncbi:hypothetical protein GGR50DRAFT_623652 [Xylaria sp. CBS 124048]|nr:hypothetical protein GGR50DRAFT_623652 [Xylaria sp. CBS 124048]